MPGVSQASVVARQTTRRSRMASSAPVDVETAYPPRRFPGRVSCPASLFAVADLVDRTGLIVGNEQRSVRREHDIGGPAGDLLSVEPGAGEDLLLGVLAVRIHRHAFDPVAVLLLAIPGAMLGDEDVVLVLGRELVAGVELHAQ